MPVGYGAYVEVFPNFKWSGSISASYEQGKKSTDTRGTDYDDKGNFVFAGELAAELGSCSVNWKPFKHQYGHDPGDGDPVSQQMFKSLRYFTGKIASFFDSLMTFGVPGKLAVRWPKFSIGGGVELAEVDGKHDVGPKGKLEWKFDPMIGASISVDILEWFMRLAGGAGGPAGSVLAEFMIKVKQTAATGGRFMGARTKAVLELLLTVGGDIGGLLSWKWIEGKCEADKTKIEAGVDFSLVGRAMLEGRFWNAIVTACATLEVKSADGKLPVRISVALQPKSNARNIQLEGRAEFNGLAFYYVLYTEIGLGGAEAAAPKPPSANPNAFSTEKKVSRKDMSTKCLYTLLDPGAWPEAPKTDAGQAVQ